MTTHRLPAHWHLPHLPHMSHALWRTVLVLLYILAALAVGSWIEARRYRQAWLEQPVSRPGHTAPTKQIRDSAPPTAAWIGDRA